MTPIYIEIIGTELFRIWNVCRATAAAARFCVLSVAVSFLTLQSVMAAETLFSVDANLEMEAGHTASLPVRLVLDPELASTTFIIIRGLPPKAVLDHGQSFELGAWLLGASAAEKIALSVPASVSGEFKLGFDLVVSGKIASDQKIMNLTVRPQQLALPQPAKPDQTPVATMAPPPTQPTASAGGLREFARGSELLKSGDIRAARLFLQRAAEVGNSQAALMLGSTYDPNTMRQLGVIGMDPDLKQAQLWYDEALRLGSPKASALIVELERLRANPDKAK